MRASMFLLSGVWIVCCACSGVPPRALAPGDWAVVCVAEDLSEAQPEPDPVLVRALTDCDRSEPLIIGKVRMTVTAIEGDHAAIAIELPNGHTTTNRMALARKGDEVRREDMLVRGESRSCVIHRKSIGTDAHRLQWFCDGVPWWAREDEVVGPMVVRRALLLDWGRR